ncbi:trehalose-phosphatase [bacterium]|nr:trehalose-phosphatase [bacterium]
MKYLFDSEGVAVLKQLRSARTLYAFDFDGTLCPIVPSHEQACLSDTVLNQLRELSLISSVAVISGRSLSDLRARINCNAIRLFGNHGAEGLLSSDAVEVATQICTNWIRSLRKCDVSCQLGEDFILEDKGISVSLHYRHSANRKQTHMLLEEKIAKLQPPPRLVPGKLVLNLVPEESPNKATALQSLLFQGELDNALFVGDDVTDEDIFSMNDERVIGVRVSRLRKSKARFFIRSQDEVRRILDTVLAINP